MPVNFTGSLAISGSLVISGSISTTGTVTISGSIASASYASNAELLDGLDSSVFVQTGSFNTVSSSFSTRVSAIEGNYATTGSNVFIGAQTITGSVLQSGSLSVNGCIVSTGQIVAQTINVQQVTSSIVYSSGSNVFGCSLSNTQQFTGSVTMTGSLNVAGNTCVVSICSPAFVGGTVSGTTGAFSSTLYAADTITVCNSTAQLNLLSTNCVLSTINLGNVGTINTSQISYDHGLNRLKVRSNAIDVLTFTNTGVATFTCTVCSPYFISSGCIQISSNYSVANVGGSIGGAGGAVNWLGIKNEDDCFILNAITAGANKNNVGIGTTCPSSYCHGGTNRVLEIHNCNSSANSQAHFIISTGASTIPGAIGSVTWVVPNSSAANKMGSYIGADIEANSSTAVCTNIFLATRNNETTPQLRLRIFSAGIACFSCQICVGGMVALTNTSFGTPATEAAFRIRMADNGGINNDPGIGLDGAGGGGERMWFNALGGFYMNLGTGGSKFSMDSAGIACFACQVCAPNITSTGTVCTTMANASCIGIGTMTPTGRLTINVGTNQNVRVSCETHTAIQAVNDAANAYVPFKLDGSCLILNTQSGGNVGIGGLPGDGYRLQIVGTSQAQTTIGQTYAGVSAAAMKITSGGDWAVGVDLADGGTNRFRITSTGITCFACQICVGGSIIPLSNGTQDLGSSSFRWCTVYTSDLSLNNGIGNYTIVEGENDLFLYNNNSCKVYKFVVQEVCPEIAPAKRSI